MRRSGSGHRPDKNDIETVAHLLQKVGFHVLRIGRFGVSVEADQACFETVLGVRPEPGAAMVAKASPKNEELGRLVDGVEVAPRPEFFDQKSAI